MKKLIVLIMPLALLASCDTENPEKENVEETITKITVTFTPESGGDDVVISAVDPDGDGPQDIEAEGPVILEPNFVYDLTLKFENTLETPAVNITEEIEAEGHEHIILFGWSGGLFASPDNGDITSNRSDIHYSDQDKNGLPIGLMSTWTTSDSETSGEFRVVLKHQPDIKSAASGINDGATDADVKFDVEIKK